MREIDGRIASALQKRNLNGWSRKFLSDMRIRFDRYGTKTRLSEKQTKILGDLIGMDLSGEVVKNPWLAHPTARRGRGRPKVPWPVRRELRWFGRRLAIPVVLIAVLGAVGLMTSPGLRFSGSAPGTEIRGTADRVVDGDTLWVCDQSACHNIRLCGVNAPEADAPGGAAATGALRTLVNGQTVSCIPVGEGTVCDGRSDRTSYDRTVAQCFVGSIDLADALVRTGHACDWVRFSGGHYSRSGGARC